jgi:F-type H+-transporting ATPase subunit b
MFLLVLALGVNLFTPQLARADDFAAAASGQAEQSGQKSAQGNDAAGAKKDSSGSESESGINMEAFRHAAPVQAIARYAHISTETAAKIFEDINSGILITIILVVLLRVVPKAFRKRSEILQKQLLDARLATTQANERLSVVEERLSKLGIEIDAIRAQTEQDSVSDEKRIQESLEAERQRIVASAEQEIEAAGAAARRSLKKFAAELAMDRARQGIHLDAEGDRLLIRTFGEKLKGERN